MTAKRRPDFAFERSLWNGGFRFVAGIDEAGRGALAGPVAVGAVVFPAGMSELALEGVDDSKALTPRRREHFAEVVKSLALAWAVGYSLPAEIDSLGIVWAVYLAARRALAFLGVAPDYLLLDYFTLPECELPQTALVKGDGRALSIAAASILAKVHRDELMRSYDGAFPAYGFGRHKGYGTAFHRAAVKELGLSAIHRRSFAFHDEG